MKSVFDFEIIEKSGRESLWKMLDLRERISETGNYPFLMGGENSLGMLSEAANFNRDSTAEILEKAQEINVAEFFERRKKAALPGAEENEFDLAQLTGVWQNRDSNRDLALPWDDLVTAHKDVRTRRFLDRCFVGIAPVSESWKVPAFVKFGGWNDCPNPKEHCAVMRYWREKYAAEIVSLTGDVIECAVENPPQTEAECFELAWRQFAYCPDIVNQGAGSVGELASGLRDSSYWYFWWD